MRPPITPNPDTLLPSASIADILGLDDPKESAFARRLVDALRKVSPALAPRVDAHPLAETIGRGVAAYTQLVAQLGAEKDDDVRAIVVDAIAEIARANYATKEVVDALRNIMATTTNDRVMSMAARALAVAGDEGFLEQQRALLAS